MTCNYCRDEKVLILTSDGNPIYVGIENDEYYLMNYDSYKGNKVKINYCPMCGKKLKGENIEYEYTNKYKEELKRMTKEELLAFEELLEN